MLIAVAWSLTLDFDLIFVCCMAGPAIMIVLCFHTHCSVLFGMIVTFVFRWSIVLAMEVRPAPFRVGGDRLVWILRVVVMGDRGERNPFGPST